MAERTKQSEVLTEEEFASLVRDAAKTALESGAGPRPRIGDGGEIVVAGRRVSEIVRGAIIEVVASSALKAMPAIEAAVSLLSAANGSGRAGSNGSEPRRRGRTPKPRSSGFVFTPALKRSISTHLYDPDTNIGRIFGHLLYEQGNPVAAVDLCQHIHTKPKAPLSNVASYVNTLTRHWKIKKERLDGGTSYTLEARQPRGQRMSAPDVGPRF
jgi:hypothetical protein